MAHGIRTHIKPLFQPRQAPQQSHDMDGLRVHNVANGGDDGGSPRREPAPFVPETLTRRRERMGKNDIAILNQRLYVACRLFVSFSCSQVDFCGCRVALCIQAFS